MTDTLALSPPEPSGKSRLWTPATTVVLIVCALVAAAAIATALLLPGYLRDAPRRDAEATLQSFLDGTLGSHRAWRDDASPLLTAAVPVGAPLSGDRTTADALALLVGYRIVDVRLDGDPDTADTASAGIVVDYAATVQGKRMTASIPQKIWLTRPFYYGDKTPRQFDPERTPTGIGGWSVVGVDRPYADDLDGTKPLSRTTLASEPRDRDGDRCYSPTEALAEIAHHARVDGALTSSCFLGTEDGSDALPADLDRAALLEAFPAIDTADVQSIPPELMRVDVDTFHGLRAPFAQFVVGKRFVLTFASVQTGKDEWAVRLIDVRPTEETE